MKKNIYIPIIAVALGLPLSSCDKFLDEVPDARTELDSPEKVPIPMLCMQSFAKQ